VSGRACAVCGDPLDGKYANAVTCGPRCRKAKNRDDARKRAEDEARSERSDRAVRLLREMTPQHRAELRDTALLAVIFGPKELPRRRDLSVAA
jgi:hypothetical protein